MEISHLINLSATNYHEWEQRIRATLKSKNLWTIECKPSSFETMFCRLLWEFVDSLAVECVRLHLSPPLLTYVSGSSSGAEIWNILDQLCSEGAFMAQLCMMQKVSLDSKRSQQINATDQEKTKGKRVKPNATMLQHQFSVRFRVSKEE